MATPAEPTATHLGLPVRRRTAAAATGLTLMLIATAGCGSGGFGVSKHSAVPAPATTSNGSPSATVTASAPAPVPSSAPMSTSTAPNPGPHPLSRAAFVARANAMCRTETAQFTRAERKLTGLSSVDGFVDSLITVLTTNAKAFSTLVAGQPDAASLEAHWLGPRFSDYAAQERELLKLRRDADRQDAAAAQQDLTELGHLPNHDNTVNPFLRSYGLTACS